MSDFCPVLRPEEPTPEHLKTCNDCGLDKHESRMIWGEGNPDAPTMLPTILWRSDVDPIYVPYL